MNSSVAASPPCLSSPIDLADTETPKSPVTLTHFQQSVQGNIEKKTIPESSNPFRISPGTSPRMNPVSSKNPFVLDSQSSSNPFLMGPASPDLSSRNPSSFVIEPNVSDDKSFSPMVSLCFSAFIYI